MLVKSLRALASVRDTEPLTAAYRARLRNRVFATAAFNPPTARREVIPVTTADGARLRVHAYGPPDGAPIVFIHGWSCSIEYWNPQINAFADRYRVIAYDQRGHGASSLGTVAPDARTLADDLTAVLDATLPRGARAVLVGHSMGGITIQSWAAHYPNQVPFRAKAVLLANTASGGIRAETELFPLLNRPLFGTRAHLPYIFAETALTLPAPIPDIPAVRTLFRDRILSPAATADEVDFAFGIIRSCRPLTRGLHAAALADLELPTAAKHLTVPTTVIAGSKDHLLPARLNHPILDSLPATTPYHLYPTGHLTNIEATPLFNSTLSTLLTTPARNAV
ncbi:alpha/beta hydrolase [Nocardia panacis]|uniref:Alpha/beta hydrolase n=1 Tax=Nocardia panacis TaxID=2340916 RepID=A0A3A4KSP6_9NOCA|nr:alpha/beta hydrolase [Nocardia panacis]RJO77910.1 alpha/beta hydrolase [Nocardia panacis]